MALRYLLPANGTSVSPSNGFKWIILAIYGQLLTSAVTGTRVFSLGVLRQGSPFTTLILGMSETGVNSSYAVTGEFFPTNGATTPVLRYPVVVSAMDILQFTPTLLSGDGASVGILVDEVIDE